MYFNMVFHTCIDTFLKVSYRGSQMIVQWVGVLGTKPDNLSPISKTHMIGGGYQ